MSGPIIIPFDNNPVSVSVKTASYTVPAGKYVRAVVNVVGSATFNINGVTALSGSQNNGIVNGNGLLRAPGTPVMPGNTTYNIGGLVTSALGMPQATVPLYSTLSTVQVFSNELQQRNMVQDYYLPTGTVINGTGVWRAVIQEYNVIS